MLHFRRLVFLLAVLLLSSSPLRAEWYEASSDHFVIYADDSPKDIQRFSEYLERYHAALELLTRHKIETPSPSNRVTIYVVGNGRAVRKLVGDKDSNVAGFYIPRAGRSAAFVQNLRFQQGYPDFSTVVLLHEYAHHFLMSSSRHAMPRWLNEGAAEFFASAGFPRNGGIQVGKPALHRTGDLFFSQDVPIRELFDDELYRSKKHAKYDAFYGRAWLLYHYLTFTPARSGQLSNYWQEVARGKSPIDAATTGFGDLDLLERDLDDYLKKTKMFEFNLPPEIIQAGPVQLRKLPIGEAAAMPLVIRSKRGVNKTQAAELVVEMRTVAARYPDDPGVLTALSEAEFDSGNNDAAIAAAKKAIANDPSRKNAYIQLGYAMFREAETSDDKDTAYTEAMKPFYALNELENDHPLPLIYYYVSFVARGMEPNETARDALERASQLAPFDQGLALQTGLMLASQGEIEIARATLAPLASNPHDGKFAARVQRLIDALAKAPEGQPFFPSSFGPTADEGESSDDPDTGTTSN